MKAKIEALNKSYLVEFKNEDQFVSFLTQHNDKINNVEVINEESLPELQKPVEVAKPSMSDGWKTLEKSAFTQKEKGVEKKGMTLGGKYAEFKYEPDKTLDNAADDKVSTPKSDSPALKGDAPEASSVEESPKAEKADAPKAEEPKAEKAEPAKEESPKAEEPKKEESDDKEDKEEKKKVEESVEGEFDKAYEEAYEVWNNAGSNEEDLYSICSDVADKYGVDADKLFKKIEDAEEEAPLFESYEAELNEVMEAAGVEEEGDAEKAKQWVLKNVIQLQTLKDGEIAPVEQRDYVTKLLAKAAARAFGVPEEKIIAALAKSSYTMREAVEPNAEPNNVEEAKQWVLKTTIQLQTRKEGEFAPVEKRDVIAKELANAASIAFDTPVTNILKALQRDHKFFPNTSWK